MTGARHLALKWRDDDQFGCVFGETMRIPSEHRERLEAARGHLCTIYIPRRGAPLTGLPGMAHVAVTRPGKVTERIGSDQLLVELCETKFLPFPVRQRSNHPIETTAGFFPQRDHSAEQFTIREIDTRLLAEILRRSNMPRHPVRETATDASPELLHNQKGTGLNEPQQALVKEDDQHAVLPTESVAIRHREIAKRTLRDRYVRKLAIDADEGQCVVTGWRQPFRGKLTNVEAAHFRAVWSGGTDTISNICLMHVAYHDLFDRFAFTISDDLQLIWSKDYPPAQACPPPFTSGRLRIGLRLDRHLLLANLRWHQKEFWQRENSAGKPVQGD